MPTVDVVLLLAKAVLGVLVLASAVWLLVQHNRRPGRVRLFRRPVQRPRLLAGAYAVLALWAGIQVVQDLTDNSLALKLISLATLGAFMILIACARRPA
ncbi:hypothetical protein [Actinoplanes auranticolor]|uniref:Uncharacterized protein n=1 Tax=Actinoplanes auranticolor TaxID=47988 RepID=A0A919VJ95_9ACTN|nr:hypothetical protein [Actinoplanes auranticolor]GIM64273.1 hypothetical protein Aau02nite_09360 [Actinoplanes auranticolor]